MRIAVISLVDEQVQDDWRTFVHQVSSLFMPTAEKKHFLFSSLASPISLPESVVWRQTIRQCASGMHSANKFPVVSSAILGQFDFVFQLSTSLRFHRPINEDILPDPSYNTVVVQHPYFVNLPPNRLPFEREPRSAAYVAKRAGSYYFTDQIFGASPEGYIGLTQWIQKSMLDDFRREITVKRRFEAYLNRYVIDHGHSMKHSGYCYPSGWALGVPRMIVCNSSRSLATSDYWVSLDQGAPQYLKSQAA